MGWEISLQKLFKMRNTLWTEQERFYFKVINYGASGFLMGIYKI
jgi:hypothetical protein